MSCHKKLWAVSTKGNVYTLSTDAYTWQRINNEGQCLRGFKKVSATPQGAWGLGCDHLVYVYVTESDVPIRVQVATYENERWLLSRGWGGDNLLPHVDPWHWSNEDGSVHLPKPDFKLPQFWQWESDWMVDENVKGYLTDKGGYRYSNINFQSEFSHKKTFKSCVRRRRWIRYRRYKAINRWARLPSIHVDPLEEPIMDLAVGGHQMPNQPHGYVSVWIVTINGRILSRIGVTSQCPEGQSWKDIGVEDEVLQLSVGAMGLLWTVSWAGTIYVRTGISWHNPLGSGWKEVEPPSDLEGRDRIVHCAVGVNAVWVCSQEGKVWLRIGVSSGSGDISESGACGTAWLRMVHTMKVLTLGQQDKVWGIDYDDFHVYYRAGISQHESSGKSWKIMDLPYETPTKTASQLSLSQSVSSEGSIVPSPSSCDLILNDEMVAAAKMVESVDTLQGDNDSDDKASVAESDGTITSSMQSSASSAASASGEFSKTEEKTDKSPKRGFRKWTSKLKTQATSKFYVPLTENQKFKDSEKVLQHVFGNIEKNITHHLEDGLDMGKKVRNNVERRLEKNIPEIKAITRRNDPDITLQYSKDGANNIDCDTTEEGLETKKSKGCVSIQLNERRGSQESASSSSKFGGSHDSLSQTKLHEKNTRHSPSQQRHKQSQKDTQGSKEAVDTSGLHTADLLSPVYLDSKDVSPQGSCDQLNAAQGDELKEVFIDAEEEVCGTDKQVSPQETNTTTNESSITNDSECTNIGDLPSPPVTDNSNTDLSSPSSERSAGTDLESPSSLPEEEDGMSLTSMEIRELEDDGAWLKYETEPDEGELQWAWVSASALDVHHDDNIRQWFLKETDHVDSLVSHYRVSRAGWRNLILLELKKRNAATQGQAFSHFKLAIEKGVWCKKGSLRWWQDIHRGQKWLECTVELTQDPDGPIKYAAFTLHYQLKGEFKFLQIDLSEMVCIYTMTDKTTPATFAIHTAARLADNPRSPPLRFAAHTEEEMEDWLAALSVGCCELRGVDLGPPAPASMWAVSQRGDIFVHEAQNNDTAELPQQMFWHQLGGHLHIVESSVSGITWGIGHNGTAYVYTGGYGGGFFKGRATSPHGIHPMIDQHEHYVYENQRWRLLRGYTNRMLLVDHYMWSDETGKKEITKEGTRLPSAVHWHWAGEWIVDRRVAGDKEGWQYARTIAGPFSPQPRFRSNLRRRRWVRRSRVMSTGPWSEVGPLPLRAITVQLEEESGAASGYHGDGGADDRDDTPVAVWAVGQNGDVLCRVGVTRKQPRGKAWHHVATDLAFVSITAGTDLHVWGVATDGSAWLRNGITHHNPTGSNWSQVPPPDNSILIQIAAGCQFVMAVDNNNVLWLRQGICTSVWEGTSWEQVTKNVQQVSIGPRDQVWVILDGVSSKAGILNGVLSRRIGMSHDKPKAGAWDHGIGGDWSYICARGWMK